MIIEDAHFDYLKLQRGALDDLCGDRAAWQQAYEWSLADDFNSVRPWLPTACRSVLDIGSGLGGIDVLLNRHYGGDVKVRGIDGVADAAKVIAHDHTFNDCQVARNFQHRNGVADFDLWDAKVCSQLGFLLVPKDCPDAFDLIISLQSWCFHYPPQLYLPLAWSFTGANTVLIIDVRTDKPEWRTDLCSEFKEVAVARVKPKFERVVFHAK